MARAMDDVATGKKTWATFLGDGAFKFVPKKWHRVRFFGLVTSDFRHNVPTLSKKSYPEYCHAYDPDTDEFYANRDERCPACERGVPGTFRYFMNLIDVDMEENKPAKAGPNWSPIKYAELSKTLFEKLQNLKSINKQFPITHPKHGAIVNIMYDPDADPANMYACSLDEKDVPLTDEQKAYVITQTLEDGAKKVLKGTADEPPQYQYVRVVNKREEMIRGLDRNQVGPQFSEKLKTLEEMDSDPKVEEEKQIAKAAAEKTVQQAPATMTRRAPEPEAEEAPAPAPAAAADESALVHAECPTSYGNFASANLCFTKCKARKSCREMSLSAKKAEKAKAPAQSDDDDAV